MRIQVTHTNLFTVLNTPFLQHTLIRVLGNIHYIVIFECSPLG